MIKLGVCTSISNIKKAAAAGFDYLEAALNGIAAMSDEDFEKALGEVNQSPIKVEACNCLLPGSLKVVGPDVNAQALHEYLENAFTRAEKLGTKVVVFGSGAARGVPEGFDVPQAWRQIANFLRLCERHAADHGITVVIEPLRSGECNIINYVTEATILASLVQMEHICVLGDTYHMAFGHEGFNSLKMAGGLLKHIHTANAIGRVYPKIGDGEKYDELFETLTAMGYEGRVSVEGRCEDFDTDAKAAYEALKAARDKNN
ncbi:MAG: sugar phosphate isomerase/epimerase [Clostridia bacterium]|nr:sugar phosphate isomerase/epimerase [Clostridia bacterium]MBQ9409373.1 sugar phosphate isomerase/epimerase [Clostridia bacterium]